MHVLPDCRIWYHNDCNDQRKRVTYVRVALRFGWGPRAGASGETMSRPTTSLHKGQQLDRRSRRESDIYIYIFMITGIYERTGHSKTFVRTISRKHSKNWVRRTNIKSSLTPNVYPILLLGNSEGMLFCYTSTAQKSKCPRRVLGIHRAFLSVFFACNIECVETQLSLKKSKQQNIWQNLGEKTKTKNRTHTLLSASTGVHRSRVPRFTV